MLELRRFAFVLVLVLGACSSSSSVSDDDGSSGGGGTVEPPPEDPAPTFACPAGAAEAFASMAAAFEAQLTENGVPGGAVAMLCGGEVQHVATHGVAFAGGPPITADTRFQWASTTKMFTGALAVALAEDGVVDLHAEVGTIAAALGYPGVTLHHLLSHTAAYPTEFPTYSSELDAVAQANGDIPMWEAPGVVHVYSNPGFAVAGHVLSQAAEAPYAALVEQRLFAPAMMNATFDVAQVMAGDHAVGHREGGGQVQPNGSYLHTSTYGPMGGAWGSVLDLARWGQVHLDPALVMSLEAMDQHRTGRTKTGIPGTDYGYGLFVQQSEPRVVHHSGSTDGYLADWQLLPEEGFGVFMVVNGSWFLPSQLGDDLIEALYAPTFSDWPTFGTVADYVGTYHDPFELGTVEVTTQNGQLSATFVDTGITTVLQHGYGDVFFASYAPTGGFLDAHFWRPRSQGEATHLVSIWGIAPRVAPP